MNWIRPFTRLFLANKEIYKTITVCIVSEVSLGVNYKSSKKQESMKYKYGINMYIRRRLCVKLHGEIWSN